MTAIEEIDKEIEKALTKLKEKRHLEGFKVEIVGGMDASIKGKLIRIGKENPLDLIECLTLQEGYHVVLQIDQTEDFKEKDKGNIIPYLKTKTKIWDEIKKDFPELSEKIETLRKLYGHVPIY